MVQFVPGLRAAIDSHKSKRTGRAQKENGNEISRFLHAGHRFCAYGHGLDLSAVGVAVRRARICDVAERLFEAVTQPSDSVSHKSFQVCPRQLPSSSANLLGTLPWKSSVVVIFVSPP